MTETDCRQASAAATSTALELFQTAALLLGDEDEAVAAVEQAVAGVKADPCAEPEAARRAAEEQLVEAAIRRVQQLSLQAHADSQAGSPAGALTPPTEEPGDSGACVDTDDLSAAGLTQAQLQEMLAHSDRVGMRRWLEGLAAAPRVIFVLRAVLGRSSAQAAQDLKRAGCGDWTPAQVGSGFRAALCSLTSALLQAATA